MIARKVDKTSFRAFLLLLFWHWLRFWLQMRLFTHKFSESIARFLNKLRCDMSIDIHGCFNVFVTQSFLYFFYRSTTFKQ